MTTGELAGSFLKKHSLKMEEKKQKIKLKYEITFVEKFVLSLN